jgi:hypothetical protein
MALDEGTWHPHDVKEVHKLLDLYRSIGGRRVKTSLDKIKTYNLQNEDLKEIALAKATDFFQTRQQTIQITEQPGMRIPPIPMDVGLPQSDPAPWDLHHRISLSFSVQAFAQDYIPLFDKDKDWVSNKADQAISDYRKGRKAQKRDAPEVPFDDEERYSTEYAFGGHELTFDRDLLNQVIDKLYPKNLKPRRFMAAILDDDDTKQDAANKAGCSRKMGHRYFAEIVKEYRARVKKK